MNGMRQRKRKNKTSKVEDVRKKAKRRNEEQNMWKKVNAMKLIRKLIKGRR